MRVETFKDKVFAYSKKKGFDDCELLFMKIKEFGVTVSKQNVENYTDADSFVVTFKGLKDGKSAFSSSEVIDEDAVKFLVDSAYENFLITDTLEEDSIYDGSGEYSPSQRFEDQFASISVKEKIRMAKFLEEKALSCDKRIAMVIMSSYSHEAYQITIFNTKGVELSESTGLGACFVYLVASDGNKPKKGWKAVFGSSPNEIDLNKVASEAAKEALSQLGAESLRSGKYRAILRNDVFADLFSAFMPIFSAESVQKGLSPLKGKINSKIASDKLTVLEDPLFDKTPIKRSFDNEGVPTKRKLFIDQGVLTTYFHSLKSAKKDRVQPTGNVFTFKCVPLNSIVKPGESSFPELMKKMDEGVIITGLDGLHSGVRTVSGEFSVSAVGYYVQRGEVVKPVEQITISGNFIDLLKSIEEVGNDSELVSGSAYFPSVLLDSIDVAGNLS
ncbi:TldD/PmbA family protein [Pseudothermotoga sp. U03pept]|uniref:TldD/PmbA family protein n=1 Tax=Pseudothermotoga sp. U03pept TaxID=3447012 RepID=UPI003F01AB79